VAFNLLVLLRVLAHVQFTDRMLEATRGLLTVRETFSLTLRLVLCWSSACSRFPEN
jgi:hypothetical protein